MTSFLLVHSPLVGPSTLLPLGAELQAGGHTSFVADLRGAPTWTAFTALAVDACRERSFVPDSVVAHSGAGAMLPAIGDALGASRLLFVDAVVPPETGNWTHTELMHTRLRTMAGPDRMLPPWHEWWNPNMMRRLVPDARLREAIEAECGSVSLDLYDSEAPQPRNWSSPESCVYIQLSSAYEDEVAEVRARAWPVLQLDGQHLDTATRPELVADLLLRALHTGRVRVGDLGALRRRGGVTVPRSAPGVLVVAPPDSGPFALRNECAHQGSELLAGYVGATDGHPWIECPLHTWRYELATGRRLVRDEPSTDPADSITTFDCAVDRDGMIWVEPARVGGLAPSVGRIFDSGSN